MSRYRSKVYQSINDYDPDCVICNPCKLCQSERKLPKYDSFKYSRETADTQPCSYPYRQQPQCFRIDQCPLCYKQLEKNTYCKYSNQLQHLKQEIYQNDQAALKVMDRLRCLNKQIANRMRSVQYDYERQMRRKMGECLYHGRPLKPYTYRYR